MSTPTLSSDLSKKIVDKMCISAAAAVKLKCGRQYGFSDAEKGATDLSTLAANELEGLPTNNLVTERDLSRFDREAQVAKSRNRRFKAKNIRNNMVLYETKSEIKVDKISKKIAEILNQREERWNHSQQEKLRQRLEEKLKKSARAKNYTRKLLQNCKCWAGPATSIENLKQSLQEKPDQQVTIVKTELVYYVHTHKADKIARPHLFKQNGISYEEKLMHLSILLEDEDVSACTLADLPTNSDVINALEKTIIEKPNTSLIVNQLCVVVWQNCDSKYKWFIAYVKQMTNDGFVVDHLHPTVTGVNNKWKYPKTEHIQTAEPEQIVKCDVKGEWDYTPDTWKRKFLVKNTKDIEKVFMHRTSS